MSIRLYSIGFYRGSVSVLWGFRFVASWKELFEEFFKVYKTFSRGFVSRVQGLGFLFRA